MTPLLIANLLKDIERQDLIFTRYLSEIDEVLVSALNSCPSFATGALFVLYLSSDFLLVHRFKVMNSTFIEVINTILALHSLIFSFICDYFQRRFLCSFLFHSVERESTTLLFDFLSNPQRSQHHALDNKMHSSVTERCFSYILNRRPAHFPGIRRWARKSTSRPWLWRWRKPKGVITNVSSHFRWQQGEYIGCNKTLEPFWALVAALKYLPYLLYKATRSEELIGLAKMWSYRRSLLVSLFPQDTEKAGKAVEHYLVRFDRKRK